MRDEKFAFQSVQTDVAEFRRHLVEEELEVRKHAGYNAVVWVTHLHSRAILVLQPRDDAMDAGRNEKGAERVPLLHAVRRENGAAVCQQVASVA